MGEERGCIGSWWGNRREGDHCGVSKIGVNKCNILLFRIFCTGAVFGLMFAQALYGHFGVT